MDATLEELDAERARLEAEVQHLVGIVRQLDVAWYEFDHQARRAGDALIRAGGRSRQAERQLDLVAENLKLTETDLARYRARLQAAHGRLAAIEAEIEALRGAPQ